MVYAALAWGALQVADLLAEAGFISEALVQALIIATLAGFPLTLIFSWFYEAPWRQRKGLSVLGDVAVILAIGVGIFLLAWQQYFVSFARPTFAVLPIEATDARADSAALGPHLAGRLRMALAEQRELAVTELASSLRPELANLRIGDRARALLADYVLTGTLNQGPGVLRVNLQLYDGGGDLVWSEGFEDRLLDLGELESTILDALWAQLPLSPEGLEGAQSLITGCEYPPNDDAIRTLILAEGGVLDPDTAVGELSGLIDKHGDNGLVHLARARVFLARMDTAPPPRRPVLSNLAFRDLDRATDRCPGFTETDRVRLRQNPAAVAESDEIETRLLEFPNDAKLLIAFARARRGVSDSEGAAAIAREAWRIDPLGAWTVCAAAQILGKAGSAESADEVLAHAGEFLSQETLACEPK